jgi:hypothetical protein
MTLRAASGHRLPAFGWAMCWRHSDPQRALDVYDEALRRVGRGQE